MVLRTIVFIIVLGCIATFAYFGFLLFAFYRINSFDTNKEEFRGVVVKKMEGNYPCFDEIIIRQVNGVDTTLSFNTCVDSSQAVWKYAKINDTIIKRRRESTILVKRLDTNRIFEYPPIGG